jgi:hypothetical protein
MLVGLRPAPPLTTCCGRTNGLQDMAPCCVADSLLLPSPAASSRVYVTTYDAQVQDYQGYDIVSDATTGTVVMRLAKVLNQDKVAATPALDNGCSATFKLIAGYAFDLVPPAGAMCPSNARSGYVVKGRTFCTFCQARFSTRAPQVPVSNALPAATRT